MGDIEKYLNRRAARVVEIADDLILYDRTRIIPIG